MLSPIPSLVIGQILIFTLALLPLFLRIKYHRGKITLQRIGDHTKSVAFLGFIFCVFASYDGDWYHYYDIVVENFKHPDPYSHIEPIHMWIITTLSFGIYLWWRIIIWGLAFWLLYLSFSRLKINNLLTWSSIIAITVIQMSTGRVYLGIALMFYGFCCIIVPLKHRRSVFKGLILMVVSIIFHKSMIIYITAGLFALIYYKKWMIFTVICCIPIFIKLFVTVLGMYLGSGEASNAAIRYLEAEQNAQGPGILIYLRSLYFLMFILFIISSQYFIKYLHFPYSPFRRIWQMALILMIIYVIVLCALTLNGIGSISISSRITLGLYFPLSILLSIMLRDKYKLKTNLSLILFFYLLGIYRLSYAYYLQSLGSGI